MEAEVRSNLNGGIVPMTLSDSGLWVAPAHGDYVVANARRQNIFGAANSALQALSLNSGTATGIIITNPPESGVIVALLEVCVSIASLPAGACSLILTGSDSGSVAHTTPLTPRSNLMGAGRTTKTLVDSAATIPTPSIRRVIGAGAGATTAGSTAFPPFIESRINGLIALPPGAHISLQALTTAVSVLASVAWEEIPVQG